MFTFRLPTENKMKGKRLLSTEDKHALIASLGVEHYLCPDFEEIKAMTPEQFVLGIIRDCNARALFCGENFTFGARAVNGRFFGLFSKARIKRLLISLGNNKNFL